MYVCTVGLPFGLPSAAGSWLSTSTLQMQVPLSTIATDLGIVFTDAVAIQLLWAAAPVGALPSLADILTADGTVPAAAASVAVKVLMSLLVSFTDIDAVLEDVEDSVIDDFLEVLSNCAVPVYQRLSRATSSTDDTGTCRASSLLVAQCNAGAVKALLEEDDDDGGE